MAAQQLRKVVIAGGGTSGWCAAAALAQQFGPLLDITLIESEEIGTVGVGEATFPTIRTFHKLLDIDEREFLRVTRGSIKLGISFENWARRGDRYIHSFGVIGKEHLARRLPPLLARRPGLRVRRRVGRLLLRAPGRKGAQVLHLGRLQHQLRLSLRCVALCALPAQAQRGQGREAHRGQDRPRPQDPESGFIESLVMESGLSVEGDLFIDCTGFRGLLIEQTLKAGYEDWSQWLRNDSALALQTDFPLDDIPPYTRAIAHESGWQWKIPLQHRQGNGHVYSTAYTTDEDARRVLMDNLEGNVRVELRLLKFRTGRRRSAWVKNCVAVGLAAGFVEPLESTSIHLIHSGVTRLLRLFPFRGCSASLQRQYNRESQIEYERIRDFIVLHYKATERNDTPYWRDCREMSVPDTLAHRLELFRESGLVFPDGEDVFRIDSWLQVLVGQRQEARSYHHMAHMLGDERLRTMLATLKASIGTAVEKMPTHKAFLDQYCALQERR